MSRDCDPSTYAVIIRSCRGVRGDLIFCDEIAGID